MLVDKNGFLCLFFLKNHLNIDGKMITYYVYNKSGEKVQLNVEGAFDYLVND